MKKKKLNKRQIAVLEDMFDEKLVEQAVLDKHKVSRDLYCRWLSDEAFAERFEMHIIAADRRSAAMIARESKEAVTQLVGLTKSQTTETARKACLDIIALSRELAGTNKQSGRDNPQAAVNPNQSKDNTNLNVSPLSEQTAAKLLAALAEENTD